MRPIARYFGGNTDEAAIKDYLLGALSTGNTLYMPQIPLKEDEADALAAYLVSLSDVKPAVAMAKESK
jgi:hypothetical protein